MNLIQKVYRIFYSLRWKVRFALSKPEYNDKVFCIGFQKTGTTSIGKSLEILGFKNATYSDKIYQDYYKNRKFDKIINYTARFDSADDIPWSKPDMIPRLYNEFPNSKFIYLERDVESWKVSYRNWHLKHLGSPVPSLDKKLAEFMDHKKFVYNFFKDKPAHQFLVLDVKDELGFLKLANFVGKKTTRKKLPHYNKT